MKDDASAALVVHRPGRPKSLEPKTMVSAWVPIALHAAIVKEALRTGHSVSKTLRSILEGKRK